MNRYADLLADDTVAIFLLHGVVREPRRGVRNSIGKHLGLDRFEAFLDGLLAAGGAPLGMEAVRTGEVPPRAFALTFDDGFANNLEVAAPALRARGVPATFYVTTGFVEDNAASWIDRIEYALAASGAAELELPFGRRTVASQADKLALLAETRAFVKSHRSVDAEAFADAVWAQLGIERMEPDPELDRKLGWDEVAALDADPLFCVGGHGRRHRILEFLDDDELEEEVGSSLAALAARLRRPVTHFSYPEGLAHCYSQRVIDVLRAHGVTCSPTAEPGVNRPGDDPFRLKRITVA